MPDLRLIRTVGVVRLALVPLAPLGIWLGYLPVHFHGDAQSIGAFMILFVLLVLCPVDAVVSVFAMQVPFERRHKWFKHAPAIFAFDVLLVLCYVASLWATDVYLNS